MVIRNKIQENIGNFNEESLANKQKFVPKRRAPYLMQEEVIKQKEEAAAEIFKQQKIDNTDSKLIISSQLVVNKESISSQVGCNLNFHEEVMRLYGLQKKIAHFFVQCCIQRNQNKTGSITSETLCNITGSTKKTIKKIIQRMIDKKLIKRIGGKRGKGGFTSFEIEQEFIDIIRLQIDLEFNHTTTNVTTLSGLNNKNYLPEDWDKIDLSLLIDVFKNSKTKSTQFFGKAQLKSVYVLSKNKLSSLDVQNSINSFAYGLKNYSLEEPYKSMINPAAILLETLKNGDKWEEKRYLSVEEAALYKVYTSVFKKVQENIRLYYEKWKETDKRKKFAYYKSTMSSTSFYNEKVFEEKAWEDYKKNLWPKERKIIILDIMGITDQKIIDRFEVITLIA